jgi:hypothetical protein
MDNRHIKILVLVFGILLVSTSSVLAFGISSPHWRSNPLEMYPGETKDISFNLQNCPALLEDCDKEDVNVILSFLEGEEIAEVRGGSEYLVPYGSANTNIILRVSVPESASVGDSYNVKFSVTSAPKGEGGNVQLGVKYNVDFPVEVGEESFEQPQVSGEGSGNLIWWIVGIVVVVLIIWYVVKRKKQV